MFHKKSPLSRRTHRFILGVAAAFSVLPFTVSAAPGLDLANLKGKVVYLDFWASWCQPCKASFPYMEKLKRTYGAQGLVIITVNVDHAEPRAKAFLQAMNSDLDVVYDPKGELAKSYKIKDMPTSLLIGRDGKIRFTHNGFYPEKTAEYDAQVSELLHEN